jgi:TonB family protein
MKLKFYFFALLNFCLFDASVLAQKVYYNKRAEKVQNIDSASYYEITYHDSLDRERKTVEVYSSNEKLMKMIPMYSNKIDGSILSFDSLGILTNEQQYINGLKNGYSKKYWQNGKVRRQELFIDDVLSVGKCFDESGNEIPYYPANIPFKVGNRHSSFMDYIRVKLIYPRKDVENNVSGVVTVSFLVNAMGKVEHIKIVKSVSPTIDKEAIRLIQEMPIATPEIIDDIPSEVTYHLPITFQLMQD